MFGPASQRRARRETLEALYAARFAGDGETFASYFAPDARVTVIGNPGLNPGAGLRVGRDSIARRLAYVHGLNLYLAWHIEMVIGEGDSFAVRWWTRLVVRASGTTHEIQALDCMRLKDGQIVELTNFFDTSRFARRA